MDNWPTVVVLLTTFNRHDYALRTLRAARDNLVYPNLKWYIADAGSSDEQFSELIRELMGLGNDPLVGSHHHYSTPGENWNKGIKNIFENANYYLRLEDDFELNSTLDIRLYVKTLENHPEVGMVRMGLLPIGLDVHTVGYEGEVYLGVKKNHQYCYSGNPAIVHKRFHEVYGYFPEDKDPGECEVLFDHEVRTREGPSIIRPANLGTWSPWGHIGEKRSYVSALDK